MLKCSNTKQIIWGTALEAKNIIQNWNVEYIFFEEGGGGGGGAWGSD